MGLTAHLARPSYSLESSRHVAVLRSILRPHLSRRDEDIVRVGVRVPQRMVLEASHLLAPKVPHLKLSLPESQEEIVLICQCGHAAIDRRRSGIARAAALRGLRSSIVAFTTASKLA